MNTRKFDLKDDLKQVVELWHEIGWLKSNDPDDNPGLKYLLDSSDVWVYEENGKIEATSLGVPGEINYLNTKLPFHGLSGVVVSPIVRKKGLASKLVSRSLIEGYNKGYAVSGLLMFEQGYYNHLGYGTGSYDHKFTFDPSYLNIKKKARTPERITKDDWKKVHRSLLNRKQNHGAVSLLPAHITRDKMAWSSDETYGLGYYNDAGEITHMLWIRKEGDYSGPFANGPLVVEFMTYQNYEQFLELLAILKNLGDQIYAVKMTEPANIQLQDYFNYPRKQYNQSGSKYGYESKAFAGWQIRILNLEKCIKATKLKESSLKFNLELHDPIEDYLAEDDWSGLSGNYQVELGSSSFLKTGKNNDLPTLQATVNSFSRMWLGVLAPSVLAIRDGISGPEQLLEDLDHFLGYLPEPKMEWRF